MSRSRVSTAHGAAARTPTDREPTRAAGAGASSRTAGALAAETWLRSRGITPPAMQRWHIEIALDVVHARAPSVFDEQTATRFHLDIYSEEWGVYFLHARQSSWIRITDVPFVHGRDDFRLLEVIPALKDIGLLVRQLERLHQIQFQRQHAAVRTNLAGAEVEIRSWIATL
jgi:hypothetical protein